MTYAILPMPWKTTIVTLLFLTLTAGICTSTFVGKKQGRVKQLLLPVCTLAVAAVLLLYASVIRAERAPAYIPAISLWFEQQPVIFPVLIIGAIAAFFIMVITEEVKRRRNNITPSSVKESLDQLETGLCFAQPSGLVILTNYRMNELSHTLFDTALQNANLFWEALASGEPANGTVRIASGDHPEFRLTDGTFWSFRREPLRGVIQITAADTTRQHQLVDELQDKHRDLEAMNTRIRSYGDKVDEYIIARERLETRVNLHSYLGQALLMTRHYLQYESGNPQRIIDIWQRNIDVLRMEAEPQQETDTLASLKNAAKAIGMQVHMHGQLPESGQIRKLIASMGAEALTNAVRHAGADHLYVRIRQDQGSYQVTICDNGQSNARRIREGVGLGTLRTRLEQNGARMQTVCENGVKLILTLPKEG